jgi:hypothetical protein
VIEEVMEGVGVAPVEDLAGLFRADRTARCLARELIEREVA